MNDLPETDWDYELWWLMMETLRALIKTRNRELAGYGITHNKVAVLLTAQSIGDKPTSAHIWRRLVIEPHSLSSVLEVLERGQLINRTKDLESKNLVRITLTEKGVTLPPDIRPVRGRAPAIEDNHGEAVE